MADILVCIKRVPDVSGEALLTADGLHVDARHVGYTVSPHELCAVELAVQVAGDTGGSVTVLTVGSADSVEKLRDAVAVGATGAVLVEVDDPDAFGPRDVSEVIAEVVEADAAAGTSYDLVLLGNDAADTGDFQVGVRLAYRLDRPVVVGASVLAVDGGTASITADGPDGTDIFEVALPAVVTVLEGGVEPRYPSVVGRMKAKKAAIDTRSTAVAPAGGGRVTLKLPPQQPSQVEVLGEGPEAAPKLVDLFESLGVLSR